MSFCKRKGNNKYQKYQIYDCLFCILFTKDAKWHTAVDGMLLFIFYIISIGKGKTLLVNGGWKRNYQKTFGFKIGRAHV